MTDYDVALKTFRYVRVIIVGMTIGLLTATVIEQRRAGCWLGSLSAYYYTPARGFFTAGLIGIGVCLVALRDADDVGDSLLNAAGVLGPMVALIPMQLKLTDSGHLTHDAVCTAARQRVGVEDHFAALTADRNDAIHNNVTALCVVVIAGLVLLLGLFIREASRGRVSAWKWWPSVFAALGITAVIVTYNEQRGFFLEQMHFLSAIALFGLIALYAIYDGWRCWRHQHAKKRACLYLTLGSLIFLGCAAWYGVGSALDWQYDVLATELWGIGLFLVFWIVQTIDLWQHPTRPAAISAARARTSEAGS